MRVEYTIPGFQPAGAPAAPETGFQERLEKLAAPQAAGWRDLLRLDKAPAGTAALAPPVRPPGMETSGSRAVLRQVAQRGAEPGPVANMLSVLRTQLKQEDAIAAQRAALETT